MWKESAAHMDTALSFYATLDSGKMDPQNLVHLLWSKGVAALGKALADGPADAFGPTGALQNYWREAATLSNALDTDYARAQLGYQGVGLAWAGEYEEAIGTASSGLEASRSLGHPQFGFLSLEAMGDAYRATFALKEARSAYSGMFAFSVLDRNVHAKLCAVAALSGEWERAREHALEAIGFGKELLLPTSYLHLHHDIEALLRGGDTELAREILRSFARRVGRGRGYFRVAYLRSAAVFARWNGDTDRTLSLLYEALGLAERLGLPGEVWQVGAGLGETHEERGEIGPSERAFGRASVVVRQLSPKIPEGELRQGFLAAPQVRRVLEKSRGRVAHPGPPVL
jgi:tetratricopeptide (TPR) repeat protein